MKYCCVLTTVFGFLALAFAMCLWIVMTLELKELNHFDPPALTKGSKLAALFASPPAYSYLNLYVFNVTNHYEWLHNNATKVALEEIGPYVFRMDTKKSLHYFGDELALQKTTQYYFEADKSKGALDDLVIAVNISAALLKVGRRWPRLTNESIFVAVNISQYFFDGFRIANDSSNGWALVNKQRLSWFGKLNSTKMNYTVHTTPGLVNKIISEGSTLLRDYNLSCSNTTGKIAGSNLFPAFSKAPATVEMYEPMLGVPWMLRLQKQYTFDYEPVARFAGDRDVFSEKPKTCKSLRPTHINGTFDASSLYSNKPRYILPVVLSHPHFLFGDPVLHKDIDGLNPDASKHRLYIDVHASSGVVIDTRLRSQINVLISPANNETLPKVIFPIFWQEISKRPEGKKKMVTAVKTWPIFAGWVAAACSLSLVAAAMLFGASMSILGPFSCSNEEDETPHTPDDIPTDELSSEPEEDLRRRQRRRALRARLPAGLPVNFKLRDGDLDDLGVTIPEWVMEKLRQQMAEQDSSSTDSSDEDLASVVENGVQKQASPKKQQEESGSQKQARPDQEEGEVSKGCLSQDIEEAPTEDNEDNGDNGETGESGGSTNGVDAMTQEV